ncbi:MAG: hypothetical protein H4O13_07580 [Xanthomonadales bacterium]|nr:hypothetical protein [Xanthomonadales bacterium]
MNCLPTSTEPAGLAHFSGADVLPQSTAAAPQDPVAAWLDLMEVVEALCPEWPQRSVRAWLEFRL